MAARDPKRERFWRRTIRSWARSRKTVRAFCAEQGLTETSFHAWRRELRKRDGEGGREKASARRSAGGKPRARAARPRFVALTVQRAAPGRTIEVERGGTTIRLPADVEIETLASVVDAMSRVPC